MLLCSKQKQHWVYENCVNVYDFPIMSLLCLQDKNNNMWNPCRVTTVESGIFFKLEHGCFSL